MFRVNPSNLSTLMFSSCDARCASDILRESSVSTCLYSSSRRCITGSASVILVSTACRRRDLDQLTAPQQSLENAPSAVH